MTSTTVNRHTREVIDRVLRTNLADWNYAGFEAEPRSDSFGDPAIYITARFDPIGAMPSSAATTRTTLDILNALREHGDERLPFLYYKYPDRPESDEAA